MLNRPPLPAIRQAGFPRFSVGIVDQGQFIYKKGFGQANLEHRSPITSHTVFDVGSMAKRFVGMAVALLCLSHLLFLPSPFGS